MTEDEQYKKTFLEPIYVCSQHKPKMGREKGVELKEFQKLYLSDPLYSWLGLDNPLMYSAHKAAGGMTSIYRQIGIGCERLFRQVLMDKLGIPAEEAKWSYTTETAGKKTRTMHLDGRIPVDSVPDSERKDIINDWIQRAAQDIGIGKSVLSNLTGVVFEVRQGYKSRDSKRQHADIANAVNAYVNSYLPCLCLLSNQIDDRIVDRYHSEKWVILKGIVGENNDLTSVYDFMKNVVGYDLSGFFERNSNALKAEVDSVLRSLLEPR